MHKLKRLLAKNNFVRDLSPLKSTQTIFELDLEANAIDSHTDFVTFIKEKNDLIVFNLSLNPLMVEVPTIEICNDNLLQNAPQHVTKRTSMEIQEIKDVLGLNETAP